MVDIDVNPDLLKQISSTTGGKMYVATDKKSLEENFKDILDHLEKSKIVEGARYAQYQELFGLPLLPAVILACLALLLQASFLRPFP